MVLEYYSAVLIILFFRIFVPVKSLECVTTTVLPDMSLG
jgi:hypothetical protein